MVLVGVHRRGRRDGWMAVCWSLSVVHRVGRGGGGRTDLTTGSPRWRLGVGDRRPVQRPSGGRPSRLLGLPAGSAPATVGVAVIRACRFRYRITGSGGRGSRHRAAPQRRPGVTARQLYIDRSGGRDNQPSRFTRLLIESTAAAVEVATLAQAQRRPKWPSRLPVPPQSRAAAVGLAIVEARRHDHRFDRGGCQRWPTIQDRRHALGLMQRLSRWSEGPFIDVRTPRSAHTLSPAMADVANRHGFYLGVGCGGGWPSRGLVGGCQAAWAVCLVSSAV